MAALLFQINDPGTQGYPPDEKDELVWEVRTKDTGSSLQVELQAENRSSTGVELVFPTSKYYDFTVYANGRAKIFTFSDGKYYLQAIQHITLLPGEKKIWKAAWDYSEKGNNPLGRYLIRASLLPRQMNGKTLKRPIIAEEEFEIHPKK
jgi:hypothetical protein